MTQEVQKKKFCIKISIALLFITLSLEQFMCQSKESESVSQSCPALCSPVDHGLPGFSVHGILQARILEGVAISFSRGSSRPRDWTQISCSIFIGIAFNLFMYLGRSVILILSNPWTWYMSPFLDSNSAVLCSSQQMNFTSFV